MDQSGSTLKTTLQGFQNIGPGSTLGVKGKIKKDGKNVRILASGFYIASSS